MSMRSSCTSVSSRSGRSARAQRFCLPAAGAISWKDGWEVELPARFANRVLPITAGVAELWGAMAGQARLRGTTLPIIDGLVAATARHHDLTVVTRNVKDFSVWGVPVINPWEAA